MTKFRGHGRGTGWNPFRNLLGIGLFVLPPLASAESLSDTLAQTLGPASVTIGELGNSVAGGITLAAAGNGFQYRFDPALGIPTPVQEGFGPVVTSRASTIGKGQLAFISTVLTVSFDSADGVDLTNGEFALPVATPFGPGTSILRLDADTVQVFTALTYGIADNVDVTFAAPVLSNSIDVELTTNVGPASATSRGSNDYTGIADVTFETKWKFLERKPFVMGVMGVVTLPTGSEENFTGRGTWAFEPQLLLSTQGLPVNAHLNVGIEVTEANHEDTFKYSLGAEWSVVKSLTVSAEVEGLSILGSERVDIASLIRGGTELANSDTHLFVGGLKWNVWKKLLVGGSFGVPLTDTGLQADLSGGLSVEASF